MQAGEPASGETDLGKGRSEAARDATGNRSGDGQDRLRGQPIQNTANMHGVLTEQIEQLHANPDLDPIRKAYAIAQLAADILVLIKQSEKLPGNPGRAEAKARTIDQLIADVHRVLAEQIETLRANPDLDEIKRARAIARLEREELRLRDLHFRRVAEAQPSFDFARVLTPIRNN